MSKNVKFTVITAWILFSRSYDAYCTNQLTPDLSKESNPLVSVLGMTWTPLLITISVLTIFAIYAFYMSIFKPKDLLPTVKGYSFGEVTAYTYFGTLGSSRSSKVSPVVRMFYQLPKDMKRFTHYMGHTLTRCLVYAGIVSTIMWMLIKYTDFYKSIHSVALIYSILIVGCAALIYRWHKMMYRTYLMRTIEAN